MGKIVVTDSWDLQSGIRRCREVEGRPPHRRNKPESLFNLRAGWPGTLCMMWNEAVKNSVGASA